MKSCAFATRAAASTCTYTGPAEKRVHWCRQTHTTCNSTLYQHTMRLRPSSRANLALTWPNSFCFIQVLLYLWYNPRSLPAQHIATGLCKFKCPHLSHGCVRLAIQNVAEDTATEQQGLLAHQPDLQQQHNREVVVLVHMATAKRPSTTNTCAWRTPQETLLRGNCTGMLTCSIYIGICMHAAPYGTTTYLAPEPSHVVLPDVASVQQDASRQGVVEALDQPDHCAFAAAGLAHERHGLTC